MQISPNWTGKDVLKCHHSLSCSDLRYGNDFGTACSIEAAVAQRNKLHSPKMPRAGIRSGSRMLDSTFCSNTTLKMAAAALYPAPVLLQIPACTFSRSRHSCTTLLSVTSLGINHVLLCVLFYPLQQQMMHQETVSQLQLQLQASRLKNARG